MRFTPQGRQIIEKLKNPFVILILLSIILVSLPLFKSGMFKIHDFTHGARIAEMTRALEDGHFPVRWSQNFGFGYGMPLFQFYGPLPFYVGSIIYWLTGYLIISVKSLFLISNIFTAWGAYLLGKKLFKSQLAASFVSIAVTLAPYRILNLYVRGALNELWGIMALPWIILGLIKVIRSEKKGWLVLCLSLSTLFLSHNITTLIFAPFLVLIVLLLVADNATRKKQNWNDIFRVLVKIAWPTMLAVGFSAFYLFPAYFEKDFTQVDKYILAEYFDFRIHFLFIRQFFRPNWGYGGSGWGPNDPISFFLGFGQIVGLFLFIPLFIKSLINQVGHKSFDKISFLSMGFFLLFIISSFLSIGRSQIIWENLPVFTFIQFPWRFLAISLLFLSLMLGWLISFFEANRNKTNNKRINIGFYLMFGLLFANVVFIKPEEYLKNPDLMFYSDPVRIRKDLSGILPDYITSSLDVKKPAESLVQANLDNFNDQNLDFQDNLQHKIIVNKTAYKMVSLDLKQESLIEFNLASYPHWRLFVDGEHAIYDTTDRGTILTSLDSGEHIVELKLQPTSLRLYSDLISLFSLSIIVVLFLVEVKKSPSFI